MEHEMMGNVKTGQKNNTRIINMILVIGLNILVLTAYLLYLRSAESTAYQKLDVSAADWQSYYISYSDSDGCWHADDGQINAHGGTVDLIYGPYLSLPQGDYTIDIDYECTQMQSLVPFANDFNIVFIESPPIYLDTAQRHVTCDFRLANEIDNLEFVLKYDGVGDITISDISISTNNNAARRGLLWLLLILLVADSIFVFRQLPLKKAKFAICVVGIAFLASLPLFYEGIQRGHDLYFHMMRLEGIFRELEYGHFPVRIGSSWIGGYGYPVSVFYGDLLLYPAVFLRRAGLSMLGTWKVYIFVVNLFTAYIGAVCFGKMFHSPKTGILLSLVYVTAPYRLVDIYIRFSVGEFTAIMFFPLVAYAVWKIYLGSNRGIKENLFNGTLLALGMTGIITTHVLSAEMTVIVMFIVILLQLRKTFRLDALRTYIYAVLLTLAMSAFFIVPFLDYYLNIPVKVLSSFNNSRKLIQARGLHLADFFGFFHKPFGSSGEFQATPGIVLMVVLIYALALWVFNKASRRIKILSTISACLLLLSSRYFPWDKLVNSSEIFNVLAQIQFPWRYLAFAILMQVLLLGCLLEENAFTLTDRVDTGKAARWAAVCSLVMTLVFTGQYMDGTNKQQFYDTANLSTYSTIGGEYLRTNEEGTILAYRNNLSGLFTGDHLEYVEVLDRKGTDFDIVCKTGNEPSTVLAPIFNYKGYVVYDDLGNYYDIEDGDNFLVMFRLPAGFDRELHIRFEDPFYWRYAMNLSMASGLLVLLYLMIHSFRRKKAPAGKPAAGSVKSSKFKALGLRSGKKKNQGLASANAGAGSSVNPITAGAKDQSQTSANTISAGAKDQSQTSANTISAGAEDQRQTSANTITADAEDQSQTSANMAPAANASDGKSKNTAPAEDSAIIADTAPAGTTATIAANTAPAEATATIVTNAVALEAATNMAVNAVAAKAEADMNAYAAPAEATAENVEAPGNSKNQAATPNTSVRNSNKKGRRNKNSRRKH